MKKFSWMFLAAGLVALLAGCAAKNASSTVDPRVAYDQAVAKINDGKFMDAQNMLQRIVLSNPGLSYIDSVQYYFAMSYYGNEDFHLAVAEFRRLMSSFPRSALVDDAQFMVGKSYFDAAPGNVGLDQADTQSAIRELKAFLEDYPGSDRRAEGEIMLSRAIERLVEKQFRAARQYYRMGNRISARLYFEDLITEYPESGYTAEALFTLAQIDEKESKFIDARDKLNNLVATFPNSTFVPKAVKLKAKIETKIAAAAKDSAAAAQLSEPKGE
ncbi:MAG: outer membrane protein assembly factor BamD [Candidatus Zixiibacteriota bacterium]